MGSSASAIQHIETRTAAMIEARGLSFRYAAGPPVLENLDFSVPRGSFVTFIGPSGSGKTTLLHILGNMYRSYEGSLTVRSEHLSFVFQEESLLEWKNALQNVLLPFEISGFPPDARERGRRMLAMVGLEGYESYFPVELSGGMKKRVELARALVTEPDLLILDEPFSSLDLLTRERLNVLLREIHRETACTVVLVTHSVEEACYLSNEIMVLSSVPAHIVAVESIDRYRQEQRLVTREGCMDPVECEEPEGEKQVDADASPGSSVPSNRAEGNPAWAADPEAGTGSETAGAGDGARVSSPEGARNGDEIFVLSEAEYRANRELRNAARSLWRRPAEDEELRPRGDGEVRGGYGASVPAGTSEAAERAAPKESSVPGREAPAGGANRRRRRPGGSFRSRGRSDSVWQNIGIFLSELLVAFVLLTVLKGALSIPDLLLPLPWDILTRFFASFSNPQVIRDIGVTVTESLSGFAIAFVLTMILGYGIAKSRQASRLLMPGLIVANTIPSVALAPFLVLWFGFGLAPKVVTSVIVIFFPMLINNIAAIRTADEDLANLKRFYGPGPVKAFTLFELPAALPMVFSGVKVSITLSVIGAVVGEFVSGSEGLGALVSRAKASFDIELMFVGLVWLALLGLTYYGTASVVYWFVTRHRPVPETR